MLDTQFNDDFNPVEINEKDRFIQRILFHKGAIILNEKNKESFMPFIIKHFGITAHNILCIPVTSNEYGVIGILVFANKQIEKERK